jgi:hypothetical protein
MKPRREYWLGLVLLFASLGLAQGQQDAHNSLSKVSEAETFLQRGTLTVWVPKTYVMGLMSDPKARVINTYPWGILQSEFKRDFPDFWDGSFGGYPQEAGRRLEGAAFHSEQDAARS